MRIDLGKTEKEYNLGDTKTEKHFAWLPVTATVLNEGRDEFIWFEDYYIDYVYSTEFMFLSGEAEKLLKENCPASFYWKIVKTYVKGS